MNHVGVEGRHDSQHCHLKCDVAISEGVEAPWLQSHISAPAIPRALCVQFVDVK